MQFEDFEYDGQTLSSLGYIVCIFDQSNGTDTPESGSVITFEKSPFHHGTLFELTDTKYEECITATFNVCKDPEVYDDLVIEESEYRYLARWLNRKEFLPFKPLDDDIEDCCYDASFNINKVKIADKLIGLELQMETNRPFAYVPREYSFDLDAGKEKIIYDESDEIGYLYPKLVITILQDGDLMLSNSIDRRDMMIRNCKKDETVIVNYPMIRSSDSAHKIQNDFNWKFLRISNSYEDRKNVITSSIPCSIKLSYNPIVKVGI